MKSVALRIYKPADRMFKRSFAYMARDTYWTLDSVTIGVDEVRRNVSHEVEREVVRQFAELLDRRRVRSRAWLRRAT